MMNNMAENAKETAKNVMDDPQGEMQKGGQEWLRYIETHPMQSIAFGLTIFLAIKGLMK